MSSTLTRRRNEALIVFGVRSADIERVRRLPACPDKEEDPGGFYVWHFWQCADEAEMRKLCFLAERDAMVWAQGARAGQTAPLSVPSITHARYVGQPIEVVAALEGCSHAYVRKMRLAVGLDVKTGRELQLPLSRAAA